MYLENSSSNQRDAWKFHYKATDLLAAAKEKQIEMFAKEKEARMKHSELTRDMNRSIAGKDAADLTNDINNFGKQRELLDVLVHEFIRNADREYVLSAGDVVYFNLQDHVSLAKKA